MIISDVTVDMSGEASHTQRLLSWTDQLDIAFPERDAGFIRTEQLERDREGRLLLKSIHELDGRVLEISSASNDILGFAPEELIGENILNLVHGHDKEDAAELLKLATREISTGRFRIRKKEGDIVWVESVVRSSKVARGRPSLEMVTHDVTQRYSVERALRREIDFSALVLEAADVHVIVADYDGRIVRCNRPTLWTDGNSGEIIGRRVFDFLQNERAAKRSKRMFAGLMADDFPNEGGDYWGNTEATSSVEWHNSAILDANGNVEYVVGIGVDPTENRKLERTVLRTLEEERRRIGQDLHDGLGQMLVGISLIGRDLANRLEEYGSPDVARAEELVGLARRADDMAHGLARGLMPINDDQKELAEALQNISTDIERIFRIRCRCHVNGDIKEIAKDAANDLFFIAQEAVSNAIKHAHARFIRIDLSITKTEIRLSIENDGRSKVPELMQGPDPERQYREPISGGLGTAIMSYRARRLGGQLTITPTDTGNMLVVVRVTR